MIRLNIKVTAIPLVPFVQHHSTWKFFILLPSIPRMTEQDDANSTSLPDLTPASALAIIQPFFPNEWGTLTAKDVTLKPITQVNYF